MYLFKITMSTILYTKHYTKGLHICNLMALETNYNKRFYNKKHNLYEIFLKGLGFLFESAISCNMCNIEVDQALF